MCGPFGETTPGELPYVSQGPEFVYVNGAQGRVNFINGAYVLQSMQQNGKPLWRKTNRQDVWLYYTVKGNWSLSHGGSCAQPHVTDGTDSLVAFIIDENERPKIGHFGDKQIMCYKGSTRALERQDFKSMRPAYSDYYAWVLCVHERAQGSHHAARAAGHGAPDTRPGPYAGSRAATRPVPA